MTRKERLDWLYRLKSEIKFYMPHDWVNPMEKALSEMLEQEPCKDCVSRKALIERINHAEENFKADNMESIGSDDGDPFVDGVLSGLFNIRKMVLQAPSVTPQEPFKPMVELEEREREDNK